MEIAAALAKISIGDRELLLKPDRVRPPRPKAESKPRKERGEPHKRKERGEPRNHKSQGRPPEGMERYRIEVGHQHDVKPGNIVGCIANEAGLDSSHIGHIDIAEIEFRQSYRLFIGYRVCSLCRVAMDFCAAIRSS